MIVAIDGPAGAGKSTVSRRLAERLGFVRVDTGALYRAVALAATRQGLSVQDTAELAQLVDTLPLSFRQDRLHLGDEDVEETIRTAEISTAASVYAAIPAVRDGLLGLQRRLGQSTDSILDGRDIGTVVFPDAEVKIYLTASAESRAQRRFDELVSRGNPADLAAVLTDIKTRDDADMSRKIAPLKQAIDAILVDTTELTLDGAVEACLAVVQAKL